VIQSILANFSVNIHLSTLPTIMNKMRYIGNTPNLPKSIDFAKLEG